jgi:hypothetical protein
MCRLLAITSQDYVSTETAVTGLAATGGALCLTFSDTENKSK